MNPGCLGKEAAPNSLPPVTIESIIDAMGPRSPESDVSRKEFRLGIYLLHESGLKPRADLLQRARTVGPAVAKYFDLATDGKMRIVLRE